MVACQRCIFPNAFYLEGLVGGRTPCARNGITIHQGKAQGHFFRAVPFALAEEDANGMLTRGSANITASGNIAQNSGGMLPRNAV